MWRSHPRRVGEDQRLEGQQPAPQIAAQLGCSAGYVRATAHRAGIKLPAGQPDGLLALGWAAREAGLTVEQIRQLGRETR